MRILFFLGLFCLSSFIINCKDSLQDKIFYESALNIAQKEQIDFSALQNIEYLLSKIDYDSLKKIIRESSGQFAQCNLYHFAARRDNIDLLSIAENRLKDMGREVACPFTPLQIAAYRKSNRVLRALANYPVQENKSISGWSCKDKFPSPDGVFALDVGNTLNTFELELPKGTSKKTREEYCNAPHYFSGLSALHLAAINKNNEGVRILSEKLFDEVEKEKKLNCYDGIQLGGQHFTFMPKPSEYTSLKWTYSLNEGLSVYSNAKAKSVNLGAGLCYSYESDCQK